MRYDEFKRKFQIELNSQQEAAVQTVEGSVLLLAVPGSGKTTVLVSRLGYMVYCLGIAPESILTVTYTVAATNDMRRRFEAQFGGVYADRLEFRTINGISQKILQYFGRITGKTAFRVADKEAVNIVKNVFHNVTGRFATENDMKAVQTAITYVKNMRLTDEEIEKLETEEEDFPEIYREYNAELRRQSLIDYDDQMIYALRILEQYPPVLEHFRTVYRYFCVDEAQDTSKIQHDMISLLAAKSGNLFMVGDEDQSIYGFRAAYPQALVSFEKQHPGARVLLMESNYRSNEEIVAAADRLIQTNKNRHEKHMRATRPAGGIVKKISVKSRKGQYSYLLKVAENCDRETAVLYRNNESALPLVDMLERKGIPYRIKSNDMTFFSHPVVNDICDYIRLAMDPCDEEAFLRIYYKLGAGISKVIAWCAVDNNRRKKPLLEVAADLPGVSVFVKKQCRALSTHFLNMRGESAGKAVYRILHYMGYQDYMEDHGMDSGKAEILKILGEQEENLAAFPLRLERLRELMEQGSKDAESRFLLSTIHSSKGLEYERVYLADMLTGIMPSCEEPQGKNPDSAALLAYEEERRLYYVGMTRAKSELYIFTFSEPDTSRFSREVFGAAAFPRSGGKRGKASVSYSGGERGRVVVSYSGGSRGKAAVSYSDGGGQKTAVSRESLSDYEVGVLVNHVKYGRGVVTQRMGDYAAILFDRDGQARKISLPIAVGNGLLSVLQQR